MQVLTEASLAMNAVVAALQPVLKGVGFRKRSHTFNRTAEDGLVQVINFQMGPFDPPGTVEIPGLRPNLYGQFAVNLGVFVEDAWRLELGRFGPTGPPAVKSWVNEYECQLRRRLDNLDDAARTDRWRPVDEPAVAAVVRGRLFDDGLVWLERFGSRARILAAVESGPPDDRSVTGVGPPRLLATRMRLGAGEQQRAQELFGEWVRYCQDRASSEPRLRGHLDYLTKFAAEVGLTMPDPDLAN